MKVALYKADTRGHERHGWLEAKHTFSFANYYDPSRIHFGALRVVNDDIIAGGKGFGTHPHDNMEIITIPLEGGLRHQDSLGNGGVINAGDIQVMSAGKGIHHSEFNASQKDIVNLFQIWVFSNKKNVEPRYQQKSLEAMTSQRNVLHEVVSPNEDSEGLWIHQNAWFSIGTFDANQKINYTLKDPNDGVFAMVIEGSFNVNDLTLDKRDGAGISEVKELNIEALSDNARILLMEVPMNF